jgi:hypothetical protein
MTLIMEHSAVGIGIVRLNLVLMLCEFILLLNLMATPSVSMLRRKYFFDLSPVQLKNYR